jgi:hypothetical protein
MVKTSAIFGLVAKEAWIEIAVSMVLREAQSSSLSQAKA